jgi:hypothetical protein
MSISSIGYHPLNRVVDTWEFINKGNAYEQLTFSGELPLFVLNY